jgi:hypothetical protein
MPDLTIPGVGNVQMPSAEVQRLDQIVQLLSIAIGQLDLLVRMESGDKSRKLIAQRIAENDAANLAAQNGQAAPAASDEEYTTE